MVELMQLVVRLIELQAEIAEFSSPQRYMLDEAECLKDEIAAAAHKLDKEALLK